MACGSSSWITRERRLGIYIRDSFCCLCCGRDLSTALPTEMALDHLEDLVPGGGHKGANNKSENLATICRACNSARGAKVWTEYYPGGAIERVNIQRNKPVNIELAKALLNPDYPWGDR